MKTLDMADKYDPYSYQDEDPTVKVNMNAILPKVYVEDDDEPTLTDMRPHQVQRGPNWGILGCIAFCLVFWGTVAYLVWR